MTNGKTNLLIIGWTSLICANVIGGSLLLVPSVNFWYNALSLDKKIGVYLLLFIVSSIVSTVIAELCDLWEYFAKRYEWIHTLGFVVFMIMTSVVFLPAFKTLEQLLTSAASIIGGLMGRLVLGFLAKP